MVQISLHTPVGEKPQKEKDGDKPQVVVPYPEEEFCLPLHFKRSPLANLCCLISGLVVLVCGIVLTCIYAYRHSAAEAPEENLFHCRVFYEDSFYAPLRTRKELEENVGIFLEDSYEQINVPVPRFGGSDPATIIHDFRRGLTAYHDLALDKCYVIDLDTSAVMPPQSLWELLVNMKRGSYLPHTYLVQEEMVVTNRVRNLWPLGSYIRRMCSGKDTYRLRRSHGRRRINKREAHNCNTIRHLENTFVVETIICHEA